MAHPRLLGFAFLLLSNPVLALPPHLYAGNNGAQLLDPITQAVIATLPQGTAVADAFMLNKQGKPYTPGHGENPYPISNGNLFIGVPYNGKTALVALNTLTTMGPPREGFRSPRISETLAQLSRCLLNRAPAVADPLDGATAAVQLQETAILNEIAKFHQMTCETLRPKTPQTMDLEIQALLGEWDLFIAQEKAPEAQALAKKAREVDLVSRTVMFEAHDPGVLDPPTSSCEREIIALSIRNRGMNPACASGHSYFGCKSIGDFVGVAIRPSQYNIWMPQYANPFMASCFLKPGLETGHYLSVESDLEAQYKYRILNFKLTVADVVQVLYAQDPSELFTYREASGSAASPNIAAFQSYYHPHAMPSCLKDHMTDAYASGVAYVVKATPQGKDYDVIFKETIVPDAKDLAGTNPAVKFKVEAGVPDTTVHETVLRLQDWNGDSSWQIARDGITPATTRNQCATMGLPHSCPAFPNSRDHLAPFWSFQSNARNAKIGCRLPSPDRTIEIGGSCDDRMQLISGVN